MAQYEQDDLDREVINLLRRGPRVTAKKAAALLGVSEQTIAARLRSLSARRQMRVLAQCDVYALGYEFVCLADVYTRGRTAAEAAQDLARIDGMHSVSLTLGAPEIITFFHARDRSDFLRIVNRDIANVDGVVHVETLISMGILKYRTDYGRLFGG